jgi:hypothetical protein
MFRFRERFLHNYVGELREAFSEMSVAFFAREAIQAAYGREDVNHYSPEQLSRNRSRNLNIYTETAQESPIALVSTRSWQHGFAALRAYRPRWHIEDDIYRELKEGWGLEKQHWGRDLAAVAIRRLRRLRQRELGNAPAVIYLAGCYGVFALEELLNLLGTPARESLLPDLRKSSFPDAPT